VSTINLPLRRSGNRTHGGPLRGLRQYLGSRPGLGRNFLVILAVMILGVAAAGIVLSHEDLIFPWQHEVTYYADFSDASAIAPGQHQEVKVAGVHVGQIGSASVTANGEAKVALELTDSSIHLYSNATATLQAKTPLNEMYVELDPGTPSGRVLKHGATIPVARTQSPVEVDQILQHLGPSTQNAMRVLLSETNVAMSNSSAYLPKDLQNLNLTAQQLTPLNDALATRQKEIATLVSDLDHIGTAIGGNDARLTSVINSAQTTLTVLANNNTALQQTLAALPGTTSAIGSSLSKVQTLTGQLNPALDNLRAADATLPTAISKLNSTITTLKPTVDDLGPVIADGRPLVANLKSLLDTTNPALASVEQVSPLLNPITAYLSYDMPWLNGFFFHTASIGSVEQYNPTTKSYLPVARGLVGTGPSTIGGLTGTDGLCQLLSLVPTSGTAAPAACPGSGT
jgi:phospholipid/cholesterol/gamma-HCH transport system substrate-binding protein